ncbi:MAG: hypothetical protein HOM52_08175 [Rhodospirillaceae bacterium]|jgi:hypothetical protein|nr:hypothetical protein [Rhodospirillaceae bacterium]MBT7291801.1 hypothetical protein [Rhodospirillaceae bacterium]
MSARFAIPLAAVAALALAACESGPELAATSAPVAVEGGTSAAFQPITDVPIPEGARLDTGRSLVLGGEDNWTGRLVFKVSESSADAFARYHQEMPRFGWRLITSVQAESSVLAFSRGERVATIQIEGRTLSGATVAITMSPRHAGGGDSVQVAPLD